MDGGKSSSRLIAICLAATVVFLAALEGALALFAFRLAHLETPNAATVANVLSPVISALGTTVIGLGAPIIGVMVALAMKEKGQAPPAGGP